MCGGKKIHFSWTVICSLNFYHWIFGIKGKGRMGCSNWWRYTKTMHFVHVFSHFHHFCFPLGFSECNTIFYNWPNGNCIASRFCDADFLYTHWKKKAYGVDSFRSIRLWFFAHFQSKVNFATTESPQHLRDELNGTCFDSIWNSGWCILYTCMCVCLLYCSAWCVIAASRKVLSRTEQKRVTHTFCAVCNVHCGATNPIIVNRCRMHNFNNG